MEWSIPWGVCLGSGPGLGMSIGNLLGESLGMATAIWNVLGEGGPGLCNSIWNFVWEWPSVGQFHWESGWGVALEWPAPL